MKIRALHVRRYRSIEAMSLLRCGGLNILIGKNNAGKSNILSAIELAIRHLKRGRIAGPWDTARRVLDEFTDRNSSKRMQIGIEFDLNDKINSNLREALTKETTQFERAIDQIREFNSLAFIISGAIEQGTAYLFTEAAVVGTLNHDNDYLGVSGIRLIEVPALVGHELFANERETAEHRNDLAALERLDQDTPGLEAAIRDPRNIFRVTGTTAGPIRSSTLRRVETALKSASDTDEFLSGIAPLITELRDHIASIDGRETTGAISAFAGETKSTPKYIGWLMEQYGSLPILHLRENKQPIGIEEASALLRLKVRRGGEERLSAVRQTVRSLLGVNIDAFEPEEGSPANRRTTYGPARRAEMDINDFVVEANGAGIREALRIILDLELKTPKLVLIEEPEVHLHPGLEKALHSYLLNTSSEIQMFLTTHSTSFVDAASLHNVYLVSRDNNKKTATDAIVSEDRVFQIPSELGLRLSTLFMFDRLVFVEGRSDENILRELARHLELDFTRANVGFVQMGGVRNFAHFAAEGTLGLLSRRRINMWFVTDRDEESDAEVERMLSRLQGRAHLVVLKKRELENYLLNAVAVRSLIEEKARGTVLPSVEDIATALKSDANELKDEVIRLHLERKVLRPIYLQSRGVSGTQELRIKAAIQDLTSRLENLNQYKEEIVNQINEQWPQRALDLAPGSSILEKSLSRYGLRYEKEIDGTRLADRIPSNEIDPELRQLLLQITSDEGC